jgi:hypothetical protein
MIRQPQMLPRGSITTGVYDERREAYVPAKEKPIGGGSGGVIFRGKFNMEWVLVLRQTFFRFASNNVRLF